MIRGPRYSKPIEAVAKRGHDALDKQMLTAMSRDTRLAQAIVLKALKDMQKP